MDRHSCHSCHQSQKYQEKDLFCSVISGSDFIFCQTDTTAAAQGVCHFIPEKNSTFQNSFPEKHSSYRCHSKKNAAANSIFFLTGQNPKTQKTSPKYSCQKSGQRNFLYQLIQNQTATHTGNSQNQQNCYDNIRYFPAEFFCPFLFCLCYP